MQINGPAERAYFKTGRAGRLEGAVNDRGSRADDVLPLLVLYEIQMLQRADDVICFDGRHVAQLLDGNAALTRLKHLQQHARQQVSMPSSIYSDQAQLP